MKKKFVINASQSILFDFQITQKDENELYFNTLRVNNDSF